MKYIKKFENNNYKFKVNDVIRVKNGGYKDEIFIIHGFGRHYNYESKSWVKSYRTIEPKDVGKLANYEGFYLWFDEENIKKARDYEINSIKYNL